CVIGARDGEIGRIHDLYFDDWGWGVRYLVVETAPGLIGRRVLISPLSLGGIDGERRVLYASLTRTQVAGSPDVATDRPVSRQQDVELCRYYGFPYYWTGGLFDERGRRPAAGRGNGLRSAGAPAGDPHLRSVRSVRHCHVHARDADIGHVADFLFDDESWSLRHVVVATGTWWPGRRVLVPVGWVSRIAWDARTLHVALPAEAIKLAPVYDGPPPPSPQYEARLNAHYAEPPFGTA